MKFFHLSDLHIGIRLLNREFRRDQEYILGQIVRAAETERPDALVIAGDVYDKAVPSAEAVEMFSRFVADLTSVLPEMTIMMISGNHDSPPRIDCFRSVLARQHVHLVGMPPRTKEEYMEKVILQDRYGNVNFYLLPFVRPSMVRAVVGTDPEGNTLSYQDTLRRLLEREKINFRERNVFVSHQFYLPGAAKAEDMERMDSEIRTIGNIDRIDAELLKPFSYAALGHIHKPMQVGSGKIRYCGTPLAYSVSEAGQQKGIVMVEMEAAENRITVLPLEPFRPLRIIKGELTEVLEQACEDYASVILTGQGEGIDVQDRLRAAFPYLLEIRREEPRPAVRDQESAIRTGVPDPFALCCTFLQNPDEEEQEILRDVINTVLGRV